MILLLACASPEGDPASALVAAHQQGLAAGAWTLGGVALDTPTLAAVLADPRVAPLRSLRLVDAGLGPDAVGLLLGSPKLVGIEVLDLGGNPLGDAGAALLADSPLLQDVRLLRLDRAGIEEGGARALAGSPYLVDLRELDLSGNALGPEGAAALAGRPVGAMLRLEDAGIEAATARVLLEKAIAPGLSLAGNPLGHATFQGLPSLSPALREVSLARTRLGPGDAYQLTYVAAPALRTLDLSGNHVGDDGLRDLPKAAWFRTIETIRVDDVGATAAGRASLERSLAGRGGR